jgi:hypothetical protein
VIVMVWWLVRHAHNRTGSSPGKELVLGVAGRAGGSRERVQGHVHVEQEQGEPGGHGPGATRNRRALLGPDISAQQQAGLPPMAPVTVPHPLPIV